MSTRPTADPPRLPEGWKATVDTESGSPYFTNTLTGESFWELPASVRLGPTTPPSAGKAATTQRGDQWRPTKFLSNGIDLKNGVVLERPQLIQNVMDPRRPLRVLGAPPAYGKTSVLQLIERDCLENSRYYEVKRFVITAKDDLNEINSEFLEKTGIDVKNSRIKPENREEGDSRKKLFLMDEAHHQYGVEVFWGNLFKFVTTIPEAGHIEFVFAVTYDLNIKGSPVCFRDNAVQRIDANTLLLNTEEAGALYDDVVGGLGCPLWQGYTQLRSTIICDSGGQAGVITSALYFLESKQKLTKDTLTEQELLRLIFSDTFLQSLPRCFSIENTIPAGLRTFLARIYVSGQLTYNFGEDTAQTLPQKECLHMLVKGGILVGVEQPQAGSYHFATPLAKRFFFKVLFPNRAESEHAPQSIAALVLGAVKTMSARELLNAERASRKKFPKEAAFQQQLLHVSFAITPEMSLSWDRSEVLESELDFFVSGKLLWGIELLRQGYGVGSHTARFGGGGKYEKLGAKDYLVVDFREMIEEKATNVHQGNKRKYEKLGAKDYLVVDF